MKRILVAALAASIIAYAVAKDIPTDAEWLIAGYFNSTPFDELVVLIANRTGWQPFFDSFESAEVATKLEKEFVLSFKEQGIEGILNAHNALRESLRKGILRVRGEALPAADKTLPLVWSSTYATLAKVAAIKACVGGDSPPFFNFQPLEGELPTKGLEADGQEFGARAVNSFEYDSRSFNFNQSGWKVVATQVDDDPIPFFPRMFSDHIHAVGCGFTKCASDRLTWVACYYGLATDNDVIDYLYHTSDVE